MDLPKFPKSSSTNYIFYFRKIHISSPREKRILHTGYADGRFLMLIFHSLTPTSSLSVLSPQIQTYSLTLSTSACIPANNGKVAVARWKTPRGTLPTQCLIRLLNWIFLTLQLLNIITNHFHKITYISGENETIVSS